MKTKHRPPASPAHRRLDLDTANAHSIATVPNPLASAPGRPARFPSSLFAVGVAACLLLAGCATPPSFAPAPSSTVTDAQTLRAGDVIRISFPRSPTLDSTQQIRRDGLINLSIVGEVSAAGLPPATLEKRLLELYDTELVAKEVRVTVVSSAFAVFVTGAVVRPGKLTPDRVLTAFDAVMEAGGFDLAKADTQAVSIIRQENGQTVHFTVNLKAVLEGKESRPFVLKAYDVVYVPEKFSWF